MDPYESLSRDMMELAQAEAAAKRRARNEQRRYEIAKDALAAIIGKTPYQYGTLAELGNGEEILARARGAVSYADALLAVMEEST